ncbi:hypothetical protein JVT61DRAFT_9445 [Boletus reticuloceps]|uniref:Uncharacterized protein n=1 Tax=Boletus reticuloceps TaxID=495285 RepID=A0A8I2YGJ9_9AGAM|nr:hypothetical protein JVT61DRAFT_9445 [Boletus reticuloceps]
MLLLTESTLFFLQLALSSRSKPGNDGIDRWISCVSNSRVHSLNSNSGLTGLQSGSRAAHSGPPSTTLSSGATLHSQDPDADTSCDVFADMVNKRKEKAVMISGFKNVVKIKCNPEVGQDMDWEDMAPPPSQPHVSSAENDMNWGDMPPPPSQLCDGSITTNWGYTSLLPSRVNSAANNMNRGDMSLPSQPHVDRTSTTIKQKAMMANIISNSKPDENNEGNMTDSLPKALEDHVRLMKPLPPSIARKGHRQTVSSPHQWSRKKSEPKPAPLQNITPNTSALTSTIALGDPPASSTQQTNLQYDTDGFIIESVKKCSEYTMKDLPVPSDYRWSRGVIGTLTLWCGTQPNIWVIPNEPFAAALQDIFNVIHPGIKYHVTTNCSALQRISEWQSSFGSAALALMISYFTKLPDDNVPQDEAARLHCSFCFLDESPDLAVEPTPEGRFKSLFLYELVAMTYLSNISGFVEVKGWNPKQLALGKNGCGVIAIAAMVLERAIEFVRDGVIDVEQVLLEMMDAPDGKMKFSASNWSVGTANYKVSVERRGPEFICSIFAEAQRHRNVKLANTESNCSLAGKDTNDMDLRTLLCSMTSLSLLLTQTVWTDDEYLL